MGEIAINFREPISGEKLEHILISSAKDMSLKFSINDRYDGDERKLYQYTSIEILKKKCIFKKINIASVIFNKYKKEHLIGIYEIAPEYIELFREYIKLVQEKVEAQSSTSTF